MRIGPLDRLVTIQQASQGASATGDPVASKTWSTYREAWASRTDLPSSETIVDGEVVSIAKAEYRTHYVAGVTAAMRILDSGVARDIVNVREVGMHRDLIIEVQSVSRPS